MYAKIHIIIVLQKYCAVFTNYYAMNLFGIRFGNSIIIRKFNF